MLSAAFLTALLLVPGAAQAPAPSAAAAAVAAEITKGVTAYNAQDLKYYEAALAPDIVYIADDGHDVHGQGERGRPIRPAIRRDPAPADDRERPDHRQPRGRRLGALQVDDYARRDVP